MKDFAKKVNGALCKAIYEGSQEPEIVKSFVYSLASLDGPTSSGVAKIRTKFIHQRPYALFVNPLTIEGAKRTELGDILFVIKEVRNGNMCRSRAIFLQAKLSNRQGIQITPHQHVFQRDLYSITFRFGNAWHKKMGWKPIIWTHVTKSKWLISNLFLCRNFSPCFHYNAFVCIARDIDRFFNNGRIVPCPCFQFYKRIPFEEFIFRLFSMKGCGCLVTSKLNRMLSIIYERLEWHTDPIEEWQEYFLDDGKPNKEKGLGVVEVTINKDTEEKTNRAGSRIHSA